MFAIALKIPRSRFDDVTSLSQEHISKITISLSHIEDNNGEPFSANRNAIRALLRLYRCLLAFFEIASRALGCDLLSLFALLSDCCLPFVCLMLHHVLVLLKLNLVMGAQVHVSR